MQGAKQNDSENGYETQVEEQHSDILRLAELFSVNFADTQSSRGDSPHEMVYHFQSIQMRLTPRRQQAKFQTSCLLGSISPLIPVLLGNNACTCMVMGARTHARTYTRTCSTKKHEKKEFVEKDGNQYEEDAKQGAVIG
uniref:Uncharacterized protein n=1 Tax=Setaria digitata TaxID=48799 RepID=A0A915PP28_9BILA